VLLLSGSGPLSCRCTHLDSSIAARLQRFASCFLIAAISGEASIFKVEARGDRAHNLDKRSQAIHSRGKHEGRRCLHPIAAFCRPTVFARLRFTPASDLIDEKGRECAPCV
jgi:hypothetical protein